jgi:hypothetical protein
MTVTARVSSVLLALLLVALIGGRAAAQPVEDEDPAQLLENFVHYGIVAKPDLASAYGQKLLESGVSNAELATVIDEGQIEPERFDSAISRMLLVPELESIAAEVAQRIEKGRLDLAREPERIKDAIKMLDGTQRQYLIAQRRLEAAGEYAVPPLLNEIIEGNNEKLRLESQRMLVTIGREAVYPLCVALDKLDPANQTLVCDILGSIGYAQAAPYLRELAVTEDTPGPVRQAADRAFQAVEGADTSLANLFANLGYRHFSELTSLIAYPYEGTNNIWSFDPFVGLVKTPVPTAIFSEVRAMQTAAKALESDAEHRDAISLYVAANLRRENQLPQGESDPVFGEAPYTPDFYATVFGTSICLDVLALAIDSTDTPLVRDAIGALAETTGGANLFSTGNGEQPLINALNYPDRRVQYEAALTLARALPSQAFTDDQRVVPLLASAVRTSGANFAVVVADNDENRRQSMIAAENLDFTIAGAADSVDPLRGAIVDAPGVDLIIIRMGETDASLDVLERLRNIPKTEAAPVLILAPGTEAPRLSRQFRTNPRVAVSRPGIGEEAFAAVVDELLQTAVGGRMTAAESEVYAIEALDALEDIAIANSRVFNIADAESALLDALSQRSGGTRMLVADILALIDSARSQQALFNAAFAAEGGERVDLLQRVADSVKRYGDFTEARHVAALLDLITNSSGTTAEAAATVHGALNLPSTEAVDLITR